MRTDQRLIGHSTREHHVERLRVLDGFSTPAVATRCIMREERLRRTVWEPAAGLHAIADVLRPHHRVLTSDIRRWHQRTQVVRDFFDFDRPPVPNLDLVTNPPFRSGLAEDFARHAIGIMPRNSLVCMLVKIQFLAGISRNALFADHPPARVHVFSFRLPRMHRFMYDGETSGGMLEFAWVVWVVGYGGRTELRWIARPVDA